MSAVLRRERGALALLLFAAAGLGISAYLTAIHYAQVAPVCTGGGVVDCTAVTQSRWSVVPGTAVPVTVPGMAYFLLSGGMAWWALRRAAQNRDEPRLLRPAQTALSGAALLGVLWFVWAELVELHRICEWCTAVHLLVLASFLVAVARLQPAVEPVVELTEEVEPVGAAGAADT